VAKGIIAQLRGCSTPFILWRIDMLKTLYENHFGLTISFIKKELAHWLTALPEALQDNPA